MSQNFPGPFTPEEIARAQAYYGASPQNSSAASAPAPLPPAGPPVAPPPPAAPAPFPAMLAANNHNPQPEPAGPGPAPQMLAKPPVIAPTAYSPEQELAMLRNGVTPAQAAAAGVAPAAPEPLLSSGDRMRAAAAAKGAVTTIPEVSIAGTPERAPARPVGGGGGGHANPDPFGVKGAQSKLLGSYDEEAEAVRAGSRAEQARIVSRGDAQAELARRQQEDAAIENAGAEEQSRVMQGHLEETQRQIDAVREQKIDPLAGMHDAGTKILAVIGGVLGGLFQGATGAKTNPFLDQLNRTIEQSIDVQSRNSSNEREGVGQRLNLLQHLQNVYKDQSLARMQARNLYYEGAKQSIEAQTANIDSEIAKQRGAQAVSLIDREQDKLALQIKQQAAQQAAAAGAAVVAQRKEAQARVDAMYQATFKDLITKDYTPEQADQEARRMVAVLNPSVTQGEPLPPHASLGSGAAPMSKEAREKQREWHNEVTGAIDAIGSFDPSKVAAGGVINAHTPESINSTAGKAQNDERDRYNSYVRQSVGAAWRLTTDGMEPKNPEILDEQAKPFMARANDNPADIQRRQQNLKDHLANAARSKGISDVSTAPAAAGPKVPRFNADGTPKK